MLLACNIGNTSVQMGVFEGPEVLEVRRVPGTEVGAGVLGDMVGSFQHRLSADDRCALCSVNPATSSIVLEWARSFFRSEPLVAGENLPIPIPDAVVDRRRVGADRLLNGLAGFHQGGTGCIVVDLGSAVTIDAVSHEGVFLGGIIAPGLRMQARALHRDTACLPEVALVLPGAALGRDTVSAIQSGILLGAVELISGLVRRLREEAVPGVPVYLTGGDAHLVAGRLECVDGVIPHLTLEGLRLAVDSCSTQGN